MPANYVLLERIELNGSTTSVNFTNIPQTGYTDLKIVISARSTQNGAPYGVSDISVRFNNNSESVYSYRGITGTGTGTNSFNLSNESIFTYLAFGTGSDATANTFGNTEIYIPNYTSTTAKSVSVDTVSETNATGSLMRLNGGVWNPSTQAAINRIELFALSGQSLVQYSTFSLYGLAAVGTTPAIAPKATGGNRIDYDGTYWIHTFTTTGVFVPQTTLSCDYLVIAGGGGSGGEAGAGGGGGGYRTSVGLQGGGVAAGSPLSLSATSYTVTVGAGGAGGASTAGGGGFIGGNGSDSSLSSITSTGGGGGSGYAYSPGGVSRNGNAGGSGGGGGNGGSGQTGSGGAASSPTQGYAGGSGEYTNPYARVSGGGGGAGAVGGNGNMIAQTGGNGGAGITSSITGTAVGRAGGGGGASSVTQGTGTDGGGTNSAGTVNTGGGGSLNYTFAGGNPGGSGIVVIRYLA